MSPIFAGIAAFFSVAAFIFYVTSANGFSTSYTVLKGCQWIYYHPDATRDVKIYYGLKGFYYIISPDLIGINQFYYYYYFSYFNFDDDSLRYNSDYYNYCYESGWITFVLTIVACIFSFGSIITNCIGFTNERTVIKAGGALLSIIACIFGIIAVGVFMTSCYKQIHNHIVEDSHDLYYGNGSILAITALLCNFIAYTFAFLNISYSSGSYAPPTDQN